MKGYQVIARSGIHSDNASDGFDYCGPFAVEISRRLKHEGWGGGGDMHSSGGIVSIEFFIYEDHLARAISMLREGMARHALNWLEPTVREIPDDAWFERLVRNKWLCSGCKGIEDFIRCRRQCKNDPHRQMKFDPLYINLGGNQPWEPLNAVTGTVDGDSHTGQARAWH